MSYVLTLIARQNQAPINENSLGTLLAKLTEHGAQCDSPTALSHKDSSLQAVDIPLRHPKAQALRPHIQNWIGAHPIDHNLQTAKHRHKLLLCIDMESTLIAEELLDEMAKRAQCSRKVADITRQAMAGAFDFEQALIQRLRLMAGMPQIILDDIARHMTLNPGAQDLIKHMRGWGAQCYIVSGGFKFFVDHIINTLRAGVDGYHCNDWIMRDGKLTGAVRQPVYGGEDKARFLIAKQTALGLSKAQSLAVGDGANDIAMLKAAGLGVAYYGKPAAQQQADMCITATDLRSLLYVQGYSDTEAPMA